MAAVEPVGRREDAALLLDLMERASGEAPALWGPMIGYGRYHYRTESGHLGEMFLTGFAPRKANMVVYIMPGFDGLENELRVLGPHKVGKSCLYLGRLHRTNLDALKALVSRSVDLMRQRHAGSLYFSAI